MNLAVVNEAVTGMNGVEHEFTEEEKNFVVQFAFRSGSKEDTISLIEALAHSTDKVQSEEIMVTYRSKYDIKPAWVEQVENLLVALALQITDKRFHQCRCNSINLLCMTGFIK